MKAYTRRFIAKLKCIKGQFALDIALGMVVVLVISAFVVMPGLKTVSNGFMTGLNNWWSNSISSHIFSTSGN